MNNVSWRLLNGVGINMAEVQIIIYATQIPQQKNELSRWSSFNLSSPELHSGSSISVSDHANLFYHILSPKTI